jgi:hypothetical protein
MMQCCVAFVLLLPAADPPPAVAMVLTTKGAVTVERGGKGRRLGDMDLLRPGDRVSVPADGEAVLFFLDGGGRERLKAKAQATVGEKGCTPADAVEVVPAVKLPEANLISLRDHTRSERGGVGYLRGDRPPTPQVVSPLYGAVILTDRPTLSWPSVAKAEAYQVELLSGDGKRSLWKAKAEKMQLSYPEKEKPLEPGKKYLWRVTSPTGDVLVDSKFSVPEKEEGEELAALKPLEASKEPADLLLAAVAYESHNVFDRALALYERLAEARKDEAGYHLALANYYERAGRKDKAEAARKRAEEIEVAQRDK